MRCATRAAHKLPKDWEEKCEHSFFRKVHAIKEEDIPPEMYVNSDQTQVVYSPGNRMTWADIGAKQVSLVGIEDKRAFTLMVSVAASGAILPFQAIYQGYSPLSLPNPGTLATAVNGAKFRLEFSNTSTYWSNQQTMRDFVDNILAPYFEGVRARFSPTQKALWQIDVWSVHRSEEFQNWMKKTHPLIILDFVPGGCTGIHQPCDVGIQRPLKLSIRRSYHEDIVQEISKQLEKGKIVSVDKQIATLRDRSVRWIWNAYNSLNKPDLVKKV